MFTEGFRDSYRVRLERSLEIAEVLGDRSSQLRLMGLLVFYHQRGGEMAAALDLARRSTLVAGSMGDAEAVEKADCLLGTSLHLMGCHRESMRYCEVIASQPRPVLRNKAVGYGLFDHRIRTRCAVARSLWLAGYHHQGVKEADQAITEALELEHPVIICVALVWAGQVFIWDGDWARAESANHNLFHYAEKHSFLPYQAAGRGLLGEIRIKQGVAHEGFEILRSVLSEQRCPYLAFLAGPHTCALAEGLLILGQFAEGLRNVEIALRSTIERGYLYCLPEILRVKAVLQSRSQEHFSLAEPTFQEAIAVAERQGGRSSLLQAAMSLAEFRASHGAVAEAQQVLRTALSGFPDERGGLLLRNVKEQLKRLERNQGNEGRDALKAR